MKRWLAALFAGNGMDGARRRLMGALITGTGLAALGGRAAAAEEKKGDDELRFPGDPPKHKLVYQFNKAEPDYQEHVLNSVSTVLRRYGDDVKLVVTCFGPGLHIIAKKPGRPVSEEIKQKVSSLSQYGVEFHACEQTMKALKWTAEDLVLFAKVVESGAADLMELQEQKFAYVSW